ncbi:DUF2726 domain-containing protein [Alteromonas oceanisediminis]|uniref:DUF2726 domain-containing protein n=1 Tax=Alteromonas oceanisediminis TaxID=2836180 RepID=UPI001BDA8859|nr:DUF2726 domain-containing protein [Alteromonas oceanisediminis]MBT0585233.1 DUF2726 domain-containing protein [Alteromonas oceanisediminis]
MELAIVLMMLLIVVGIGAVKLSDQATASQLSFPFRRRQQLFTPAERNFLALLENAIGGEFRILCRVKLADMISIRPDTHQKNSKLALSKANGKQLDFVLCDKQSMDPVLAIDLVNQHGKEGYKQQRDWFVNGALDAAKVPHMRVKVKSGYTVAEVRDSIEAKLIMYRKAQTREPLVNGHGKLADGNKRPTRPLRSSRPITA